MKPNQAKTTHVLKTRLVRASISFPPDLYEALEAIAKRKKVSLAWVVRDAAETYVVDDHKHGAKVYTQDEA